MREYVYFSERLVSKILTDNDDGRRTSHKSTLAFRPGGIGGDITWDDAQGAVATRHAQALRADDIVADHAVWAWDVNESATYVRGRGMAFLADLVGSPRSTQRAMFGSTYPWQGREVNLCLFGSRHNLDDAVPDVDASRRFGWHSSSTSGVRQLLAFAPGDGAWDEDGAYERAARLPDTDLAWSAANIMRGQGITGDGNRRHARAPALRGHTIMEGDFEWLARIYWWESGVPQFHNVAVGAPVYVRTVEGARWTPYGAADLEVRHGDAELPPWATPLELAARVREPRRMSRDWRRWLRWRR